MKWNERGEPVVAAVATTADAAPDDHPPNETKAPQQLDQKQQRRRPVCTKCHRPTPRACICKALPETLINLHDVHLVILQHPHEFHHKNNRSIPVLELCVHSDHLSLCVGRRLGDQIPESVHDLLRPPNLPFLIFPQTPIDAPLQQQQQQQGANSSALQTGTTTATVTTDAPTFADPMSVKEAKQLVESWRTTLSPADNGKVVLLSLDATWKYAKEMHLANIKGGHYPPNLHRLAIVKEDLPLTFQPRRFDIRTTPTNTHKRKGNSSDVGSGTDNDNSSSSDNENCWMCTAECLAWIASELHKDDQPNNDIYNIIMKPIDYMVQQWHSFINENRELNAERKRKRSCKTTTEPTKATD